MIYKVSVGIPPEYAERMMDAVDAAIEPIYPGYRRVFSYWPTKGTWIPTEGSHPFLGTIGEVETADELRVEFAVKPGHLEAAIAAVLSVHPYEEPGIDVIPMEAWKDFAPSCR